MTTKIIAALWGVPAPPAEAVLRSAARQVAQFLAAAAVDAALMVSGVAAAHRALPYRNVTT